MKRFLAVFDCDSTIIHQEIIDELGRLAGKEREISRITDLAMQGKIDYSEALKARVAEFRGLSIEKIKSIAHEVDFRDNYLYTLRALKERGFVLVLITGSFSEVLEELRKIGMVELFDFVFANELLMEEGVATGDVKIIVGSGDKERILVRLQKGLGILPENTVVVGDGANDVPMFKHARVSIALDGKPRVREASTHAVGGEDFSQILEIVDGEFKAAREV